MSIRLIAIERTDRQGPLADPLRWHKHLQGAKRDLADTAE